VRAVARVRRCDDRAVEDGADTTQALARAKPLAKKLGASLADGTGCLVVIGRLHQKKFAG